MTTDAIAPATDDRPPLPWKRLGLVALLWAVQLFVFQHLTFAFDYPAPIHKHLIAGVLRAMLDLLFCAGLVFLLPRLLVAASLGVFVVFAQAAGYYHEVFGRAISWTTFRAQSSEGLEGAGFDWSYLHWAALLTMLALFGLELALLFRGCPSPGRRGKRVRIGLTLLAAYVVALVFVTSATAAATVQTAPVLETQSATSDYDLGADCPLSGHGP